MEAKDIPRGDKIMIRPALILDRKELSPAELAEIQNNGRLSSTDASLFELEVQGLTIARGKLIKKKGKYYFKIIETAGGKI
jgi:hypothetical protein